MHNNINYPVVPKHNCLKKIGCGIANMAVLLKA